MTPVERTLDLGGLTTTVVSDPAIESTGAMVVVLLHGYAMQAANLAPFAHSIGVPALFLLPTGFLSTPLGARAWWDVDVAAREAAIAAGSRDLVDDYPVGAPAARAQLGLFLEAVQAQFKPRTVVVGGFSQGGMLALDFLLHESAAIDALVLLSSSRISRRDWEARRAPLRELPVFVSHGETDTDLAFTAGTGLRDFVLESGAAVTWIAFPGGHEIPLVVWRGLRKFLTALLK